MSLTSPIWHWTIRVGGGLSRRLVSLEFDELMAYGLPIVERLPSADRIYLTFDDSPRPATTPAILGALARHDVRATFFVVGQSAEAHPDLMSSIVEAGHEIGNHTHSHLDLHRALPATLRREIVRCQNAVANVTSRKPTLFRAPFGHFRWDMRNVSALDGITTLVRWDVAPHYAETSPHRIAHYIIERAEPGSIILLHDGLHGVPPQLSHEVGHAAASCLDILVPALRKRGLSFATLEDGLPSQPAGALLSGRTT